MVWYELNIVNESMNELMTKVGRGGSYVHEEISIMDYNGHDLS